MAFNFLIRLPLISPVQATIKTTSRFLRSVPTRRFPHLPRFSRSPLSTHFSAWPKRSNSVCDLSHAVSAITTRVIQEVVKTNLLTECKCHGVSGSCTMKTCWKSLPPFRQVGDSLLKKYTKSREVVILQQQEVVRGKVKQSMKLVLKKIQFPRDGLAAETPKKSDLVHLEGSPNYCEKDVNSGSLGTVGRFCNRTSKGTSGCDLLCCGRGYNTHQYTKSWQCRCKFRWCCHVNCDTCVQKIEEYTCK